MLAPSLVPSVPEPGSPAAIAALLVGVAFFAVLVLRALKTYLLTLRGHQASPTLGHQLLRVLGGFSRTVLELVHSHHERLDGEGNPRGLAGRSSGLDTRILTVCDVYDALVAPRVYRAAWSHEAALALLRDEAGTAFDERCVAALERVLERERPQRCVAALERVLERERPQRGIATLRVAAASA